MSLGGLVLTIISVAIDRKQATTSSTSTTATGDSDLVLSD